MGEEFEDCAAREILEETGLVVEKVAFLTATNDVLHQRDSGKHYVTIWMSARVATDANVVALAQPEESARETGSDNVGLRTSGSKKDPKMPEARLMEPQSCAGWEWVSWEQLEEWGLAQIERENLQIEREKRGMSTRESDCSSEISCGPRNDGARTLFSPMINLLVEREGIDSRLSSACAK
jgi:ADP-ribose pyrophosphatase YjhB (NUDIX family)